MNVELFRNACHEYLSLISGSDSHARNTLETLLGKGKRAPIILHFETVHKIAQSLTSSIQFIQPQLDEIWQQKLLNHILIIAKCGADYKTPLRNARSRIDYVFAAHDPEVVQANLIEYLEMEKVVTELSDSVTLQSKTELNQNSGEDISNHKSSKPSKLLLQHVLQRKRLLNWVQRAVITDTVLQRDSELSEVAQILLYSFRDNYMYEHHRDEDVRFVFSALDRRDACNQALELHVTSELFCAIGYTCDNLKRIRSDSWTGSFEWFIKFGQHDIDTDDNPVNYIEDEFKDLGEFAHFAQLSYQQGSSLEEARKNTVVMKQFWPDHPGGTESSDKTGLLVNENTEGLEGMKLDYSSHANSSDDLSQQKRDISESTDTMKVDMEPLMQLANDFGKLSLLTFANIDYGLTGIIDATEENIFSTLASAFQFKYGSTWEKRFYNQADHSVNGWMNSKRRTDVLLIALSYKHQGLKQRLAEITIRKIAQAISSIASMRGISKVNIWLDAILSANKDLRGGCWAVNGIYPYLTCEVLRVVGKDENYYDGGCASMWMKVEEKSADEKSMINLRLDSTKRGYCFERKSSGKRFTVRKRMMDLAREICKGMLIGMVASWAEDKKNLIIWAENCLLQDAPVLMNDMEFNRVKALRIDNMGTREIREYVEKSWERGFIVKEATGLRESLKGWNGVFELFPGLREASGRSWIPLLPIVNDTHKLVGVAKNGRKVARVVFEKFAVLVDMDADSVVRQVTMFENETKDDKNLENDLEEWSSESVESIVSLTNEDEARWCR